MHLTDALCIVYSVFQIVYVSIFGARLEHRPKILIIYLGCIAVSVCCIWLRGGFKKNKAVRIGTLLYPLLLLIPFYSISGYEVHMFYSGFFDKFIIHYEFLFFAVHPSVWFQNIVSRPLTEWMMFGYSFYLFLLPITTAWLYCTHKSEEWQHLLGALLISFFVCYIIFTLLPVQGPRVAMADLYNVKLQGYLFQQFVALLESRAMLHGGAFPSAHCSAATVMLVLAYRYDKRLFIMIAPIIITLYISTVYGRYHYPTDVLGGIIVGFIGIYLYWPLKKLWENVKQAKFEYARKSVL